jgi:hypothetical protein
MSGDRAQFEAWINNPHMLDHRRHPATWGAPAEDCQRHEANPYSHPYTKGAWEAWKARALLAEAQPEPVEPTDAQLDELWAEVEGSGAIWAWQHYARAVLARWGSPAPEPVSVSNRLPTQELNELDDQGTCWMFHQLNFHYCLCRPDPSVHTHWLPHWALPVPQEQADA